MLSALLFGFPAVTMAQARDPAAAEALFHQGRQAAKDGDYRTACEKFRESNRLDPAIGTVFNIADCEQQQGRLATAWTLFQEVIQRLPANDERRVIAAKRVAELEPRLPRLSIRLEDAPADSVVLRDDVELGRASLDTPLPVDPGKHRVVVQAPGHEPGEHTVVLEEGQSRTLAVSPGPKSEGKGGVDTGATVSSSDGGSTLGWVALGVGAAGVVVGAVTGLMVLDRKSTVDERCDAAKRCDAEGFDAAESGRTLGSISGIAFAVGAVGLASGAYLLLSRDDEGEPGVALVGGVSPSEAGVSLHGHF